VRKKVGSAKKLELGQGVKRAIVVRPGHANAWGVRTKSEYKNLPEAIR